MPTQSTGDARIERIEVDAFTIPTEEPESDGTFAWDKTTLVVVHATAAGTRGMGYTYADVSAAALIEDTLANVVLGRQAMDVPAAFIAMVREIRNLGRPGICSMAISAVDASLRDLKARLLGVPLVTLLGAARPEVMAYGSGGFTSYSDSKLRDQMERWASEGFRAMKMKIGRDPGRDIERVRIARQAAGDGPALMVDANGAYSRTQALAQAQRFAEYGVTWFEQPVSSDDLDGLHQVREHAPPGMRIAAGEYGYDLTYFHRMLDAGAVDVLQADATRCSAMDFLRAEALCAARSVRLSAHTAPSVHTHLCCAAPAAESVEYFVDHARIERMLFDGAIQAANGVLRPDLSRPGMGLELKRADAAKFQVFAKKIGAD